MKNKFPEKVKLKTALIGVLVSAILIVASVGYGLSQTGYFVGDASEVWVNPPFSEATYIVGVYSSTQFYAKSGTTGEYESLSASDDTVLQYAVDQTATNGGMVYVQAGTYSASVTVKDKVRLVLEKGATGITVSINAGATCWVEDYNTGRTRFYSSGSLTWDENYATSTISTLSWINVWNQTVIWVVENYTGLLWRGAWNTTVQNIVDLYALTWKGAWNVTVRDVIETFDSLSWKGLWNSTVEAIIDNHSIAWNDGWNTTVQNIIDSYSINWKDSWNSTVQDIIANYVWQNSLDMNQNQIVNMTFWSGTSFPPSPIEGQPYWRTDENTFYVYNGTAWESMAEGAQGPAGTLEGEQPYSYLVFTNATATYMQNGTTSTIDASSTNASQIWEWTRGNCSAGGTIFWKAGNYTFDSRVDVLTSSFVVRGEGDATLFHVSDGANLGSFIHLKDVEDVVLRDFKIDANRDQQASGTGYTVWCEQAVNNSLIENLHIIDSRDNAIRLSDDCHENHIIKNHIENAYGHLVEQLVVGDNCTDNIIAENIIDCQGGGGTAIVIGLDSHRCIVDSNICINGNTTTGAANLDGISVGGAEFVVVSNNYVEDFGEHGIDFSGGSNYGSCTGNTVLNCPEGIHIVGNNFTSIVGNTVKYCGAGIGILATATPCDHHTVQGNTLENNSINGISCRGRFCTIGGNTVNGSETGIYLYFGSLKNAQCVVSDNTVTNCSTGIRENNMDYNTIHHNVVATCTIPWSSNVLHSNIFGNVFDGLPQENFGVVEASNDDYIAHGCVRTPTVVLVTVYENDANYFAQVKYVNATHFRLHLYDHEASDYETVDKTIMWRAFCDLRNVWWES